VPAATDAAEEAAAILRRTEPVIPAETAPPLAETESAELLPMMPVSGEILQRFSQGELVKSETTGIWSTHNGNDYAVPLGTEVSCTEDGTVSAVGRDTLWGVCVTVLHEDGTETRYCGLNENLNIQAGDVIPRGTVLGTVGATNEAESALAPHLHFEVRRNDRYFDPESYFAAAACPDGQ
jgi:murein DD-endopeptidase MepM/ murein hydrolase activator NlpD